MESDKQNEGQGETKEQSKSTLKDLSKSSEILPPSDSGSLTEKDLEASPVFRRMQGERDSLNTQLKRMADTVDANNRVMADLQAKYDEAMLAEADTDKVKVYLQQMNMLRQDNVRLKGEVEKLTEDNNSLAREAHYAAAARIANKYGCDARDLMVAYSEQDMEYLAQRFQSLKPTGDKVTEKKEEPAPEIPNTPDSATNIVAGGSRQYTKEEIDNMDWKTYKKLKQEGKIKLYS